MIKLFGGTANPPLVDEVADILNLLTSKSEIIRFANSELRIRIEEDVKNQTCVIIQSTSNPTDNNLIELVFLCDTLKKQSAKKIIGFIPYFGYARQNLQYRSGECVSVDVVIRILNFIGFSKIFTIDLHDITSGNIFSIPYKDLSAIPLLAKKIRNYFFINHSVNKWNEIENYSIVAPDQGARKRAELFSQYFYQQKLLPIVVIDKKRDLNLLHQSKALKLHGSVNNKIVILVDDIITSGGTLTNAAQLCLQLGAKKIIAATVHHDFSPTAPQILQSSPIEKIFTTNTIMLKPKEKFDKLEEISIASLITKEIKNL